MRPHVTFQWILSFSVHYWYISVCSWLCSNRGKSYADNAVFFSLETAAFLWRLPLVSSHLSTLEICVLRVRGNCHQEVSDDQRLCCTLSGSSSWRKQVWQPCSEETRCAEFNGPAFYSAFTNVLQWLDVRSHVPMQPVSQSSGLLADIKLLTGNQPV